MIYACIRFLQEWATPLTVINYILFGGASGFTLATAYAAWQSPGLVDFYGGWAIVMTILAFITRSASLVRNARLKHKSTLQSAIGVRHARIEQKAQGAMAGSYNTREFFHGASPRRFVVQYLGLLAERWFFFAQANHPQNLYYQTV